MALPILPLRLEDALTQSSDFCPYSAIQYGSQWCDWLKNQNTFTNMQADSHTLAQSSDEICVHTFTQHALSSLSFVHSLNSRRFALCLFCRANSIHSDVIQFVPKRKRKTKHNDANVKSYKHF